MLSDEEATDYSADALDDVSGSKKSSGYPYLDSLVPSYLSVDTDGRVVRLDTFSKTIAPGCRLGWITAQPAIIERLQRITETSTQQPSGFVQSMVAELLIGPKDNKDGGRGVAKDGKGWGFDGWVRWLEGMRGSYEIRMRTMCSVLENGKDCVKSVSHPGNALSERWEVVEKVRMFDFLWPKGGMFVWIKLNLKSHPLSGMLAADKLAHALWVHLTTKKHLVLVAPGLIFSPTPEIAEIKAPYHMRLCFAAVEGGQVKDFSQRFVEGCSSFWSKTDIEAIRVEHIGA